MPADLLALSNGAEIGREDTGDGRVRVRFADTMVMSTYLVAFVVGPLEATDPVDVDGVPLRVVHPLGKADLAGFALDIGASALRYFADYYGIGYPGGKVDLVAIPDFAFGAMENLGCITFRETALLVDPARATQPELERVADVVAHELAHMWFGDLVTMKWWNGIWLNEAFATFMETLAVDHFRPDWDRWTTFALSRSAAYDTDSLAATRPIEFEVVSPADAEGMFDVLTYEKGASVVRMLEQYLGEADFRTGIRAYLAQHAYGNTETTDLWDALEAATGQPVRRIADTWIFQGGHPAVGVDLAAEGTVLRLTQEQFRYLGGDAGARWAVPVLVRWADASTGDVHERKELLDGDALEIDLPTRGLVGGGQQRRQRLLPGALHAPSCGLPSGPRPGLAEPRRALLARRRHLVVGAGRHHAGERVPRAGLGASATSPTCRCGAASSGPSPPSTASPTTPRATGWPRSSARCSRPRSTGSAPRRSPTSPSASPCSGPRCSRPSACSPTTSGCSSSRAASSPARWRSTPPPPTPRCGWWPATPTPPRSTTSWRGPRPPPPRRTPCATSAPSPTSTTPRSSRASSTCCWAPTSAPRTRGCSSTGRSPTGSTQPRRGRSPRRTGTSSSSASPPTPCRA